MANFCPKCGEKNNPDDRFCKNCGVKLIESAEVSKEELRPESPPQTPAKSSEPPVSIQIIKACIQLVLVGLFLYWGWYSYNCATGKYPNTGDQTCQWFHQSFSGGGGTPGGGNITPGGGNSGGGGGNKTPKCISTGCGSSWYCSGSYYVGGPQVRINGCLPTRAGDIYSGWSGMFRQCP